MVFDNHDVIVLQEQLEERDRIIDDLQAAIRGMEQKITEDGRRIAELEESHAIRGLGALALAEKRGRTITELVDEKIDLRRQLEDAQAERDCYKAGFDAADIAMKHQAARANELAEQLDYAQATILKQAQRMAHLEAELHDLKAAHVAKH